MTKYFIISLLLMCLLCCTLFTSGQNDSVNRDYKILVGASCQDQWLFFNLPDSISAKIIESHPASAGCGGRAFAGLTIVATKNDTIRVLSLCDEMYYEVGSEVRILPRKSPQFQVNVGFYLTESKMIASRKATRLKPAHLPGHTDSYEKTILKTTWGIIEK